MRILALDAATEACSAALYDDGRLLGRYEELARGHSERLLGMVRELLAEAGWTLGSLDGLAAGIGPGSFTGVRIGVAVAQGLAFGAGLRVVPISSLEALARKAPAAERVLACLDARMGEVYSGCFTADPTRGVIALGAARVGPASAVSLPEGSAAAMYVGVGRGFAAYPELGRIAGVILPPGAATALPDAREIAGLAALRLTVGEGLDPADLAPLYVRDKVALTEMERRRPNTPEAAVMQSSHPDVVIAREDSQAQENHGHSPTGLGNQGSRIKS